MEPKFEEQDEIQRKVEELSQKMLDMQRNFDDFGKLFGIRLSNGLISPNWRQGSLGFRLGINDGEVEFNRANLGSVFYSRQVVASSMESLDGWTVTATLSGAAVAALGSTSLETGATDSSEVRVLGVAVKNAHRVDYDNANPMFETQVAFSATTSLLARFGVGNISKLDSTVSETREGFGFRIDSEVIQALTIKADTEKITIISDSDISTTNINRYQAVMNSDDQKVDFYINGKLLASHDSTDLPSGFSTRLFSYYIKTRTGADRQLSIGSLCFAQDL